MKKVLTESDKAFIDANYLALSAKEIAKERQLNKGTVRSHLRKRGISIPKDVAREFKRRGATGRSTSTAAIDKLIRANYLALPVKALARLVDKSTCFLIKRMQQLGLEVPGEIKRVRSEQSRIKKGNVPLNKGKKQPDYMSREAIAKTEATRFKKGNLPHNSVGVKDGDVTIRGRKLKDGSIRPYKYIRVALGKWKMLHVHNWEQVHGPLPDGHIVVFKNKDTMNCDIANLEMVTLAENMARNTIQRYPEELKESIKILAKLKKRIHEKQTN